MHRITRPVRLLVAVVLVAGTLAACASQNPADGNRVLLIGDSLLVSAQTQTETALRDAGWDPTVQAVSGSTIEDWSVDIQDRLTLLQPDVVVLELGTNSCGQRGCPRLEPYIDTIVKAVHASGADALLWLNVQVDSRHGHNPKYVNAAITNAVRQWPFVWPVDLDGLMRDRPEWHEPDGLHFNNAGQAELAALFVRELEPFLPTG